MLNLLPEKNKKEIFFEFIIRMTVVFLVLLFFLVSLSTIFLIPSYVLSQVREIEVVDDINILRKSVKFRETSASYLFLNDERVKIECLEKRSEIDTSDLLETVIKNKPNEIKLNNFFYEKISTKNKDKQDIENIQLVVRGIAYDRNSLIDFINRLKQEESFVEVNFPVSNLIKDEKVDFSINILVKQ